MANNTTIDLWFWRLDASPGQLTRWRTYLNGDEHARMARFVFDKDKTRFTICRSRMRRILGWYTTTNPRDVEFGSTGRNKPILVAPNASAIEFNLTHTAGLACLAVARGLSLGVDLEESREVEADFIAHTLNPAEFDQLSDLPFDQQQTAFLRIWTAKEAYLKAIGTGLFQSLKTFDVALPPEGSHGELTPASLTRIDSATQQQDDWQLYTFRATDRHVGALACAATGSAGPQLPRQFRTRWID